MTSNKVFLATELIEFDPHSGELVPIDIEGQFKKDNLTVTGSESYNHNEF